MGHIERGKQFFNVVLRIDATPAALAFLDAWIFSFEPAWTILVGLVILILDIGWFFITIGLIIHSITRRAWLILSARVFALLITVPVGIVCARIPDYVHLAAMWSELRALTPQQPHVFEWGYGGMVPATFTRYLVYVPHGGTLYGALLTTFPGWTDQSDIEAKHLVGPYYVVQGN